MPGSGPHEGLLMPPVPEGYQSDGRSDASTPRQKRRCCFSNFFRRRAREPSAVSGYQVIIRNGVDFFGTDTVSLSDPRLKPKIPKCFIALLVLICLGAILSVFFLVPRGVVVDQVNISKDIMTRTLSTYTLVVDVGIPISNRNYLPVVVSGNVTMYYYQQMAGSSLVPKTTVGVRAEEQVDVSVDASFVPMEYIAVVLRHCSYFPYELVFFLEGHLQLETLFETRMVELDTYSFIRCPDFG
ncbi:hypothetical protein BSKO_03621 [Bryopsis sp. KO-2023]|nr:hypothetical protein BSKO_03621 [Bryopsis sp. KO-2023]